LPPSRSRGQNRWKEAEIGIVKSVAYYSGPGQSLGSRTIGGPEAEIAVEVDSGTGKLGLP